MGNLKNLPTEILTDIITRLPTESILDCKLVRKSWRFLVSHDPLFSQLHLTRLLDHSAGKLSFLFRSLDYQLHYFEYCENNDETPTHSFRRVNLTTPFSYVYQVIGSANGLVCVYGWQEHITCICNPVTKKYVSLPRRDCDDKYSHCSGGFAYLPKTKEYKVLQLYRTWTKPYFIDAEVYTLGSGNKWRIAGRLDSKFSFPVGAVEPGVYANGAIHWKEDNNSNRKVLVFDLIEERFCEYHPPPPMPPNGIWLDYFIGELGGVLYYAVKYNFRGGIRSEIRCDIWLWKKKKDNPDVKEQVEHKPMGWSKEFTVPGNKPVVVTKRGSVLCFDYKYISVYDAIASTSNTLVDAASLRLVFPHKNTLVSLREFGEEGRSVMESAEV